MSRLIPEIRSEVVKKTAARCRQRGVVVPTLAQMRDPSGIPASVLARLPKVGLWDVDPVNLFRISWKNDPSSGLFGHVNALELPPSLTGIPARVVGLLGKIFPTGAHKVGAAFGCLLPRLASGTFDPERHKAVWPSTGNFCRGGAFDCALLGCTAVAVLPEEMSRERFEWLQKVGAEIIATPGCESNVKEIYDKCHELRQDPVHVIFNQFEEMGNPLFHYSVTGPAAEEAFRDRSGKRTRVAAFVSATGSAGTIAAGDYLKKHFPGCRTVAAEALQCPTLLSNGFGAHRIEGIGDKHVPWVHNARTTDAVSAVDDEDCMRLLRLFNEEAGQQWLEKAGVPSDVRERLPMMGISSICNMLSAVKAARHFELTSDDVILTVFTDSAELYGSRLEELRAERGTYGTCEAARDHDACLLHQRADHFRELTHPERRAIHNLKYYTWVEQQGRTVEELEAQWDPSWWEELYEEEPARLDGLIASFNHEVGLGEGA